MKEDFQIQSDEELMLAYQKGNVMAYEVLYKRHSPRIYGYIRKQIGEAFAADAHQETFIKLHNSRDLFNHELPFLPWLFTITKNVCTDFLRREGRSFKTVQISEEVASSSQSINKDYDWAECLLEKLASSTQQQAIRMRYFQDWSFEEIAKTLETTPANSRKLISRGLKQLKEIFASHGGNDETK